MTTSLTNRDRQPADLGPDESATASLRSSRVLQAAVGLVVVQLAFRAWATLSSWYTFDDFLFISRMSNDGLLRSVEPYAGHVMPGGMFLSWLADQIAPYDFRVTAAMLLLMQLLASVGLLVLLVRLFGVRAGILPPLVLYLFCVISVPVAIWWAAGVNQLPLQIALFWGLAAHVQHLRTRRLAPLLQAVGWLLVGLAFYEKTLLVLGAIGIVSLSYFATGGFFSRLAEVWRAYRTATLTYVGLGLAYLVTYVSLALNFGAGGVTSSDVGGVVSYLVLQGYAPAVVGGPLHWTAFDQFSLADPGNVGQLASVAVIGLVLRELSRSRSHSLRAWWLVLFFLTCDVVLVAAGRATFVGALISLDYRYQGEMAAVTAIALGCAAMPIIGAREVVARTGESALLDHPRRVVAAVTVVAALSVVSSVQYVWHWKTTMPGKPYFTSLLDGLRSADEPVPLVDDAVPTTIMWPLGYPENLLSHLLVHYSDRTDFVEVSTDHLNVVDDRGHVVPAQISGVRWGLSGPRLGCGYAIGPDDVTLPLDGPVAFGGWWVRIGYLSSGTSPVVVTAGANSYSTVIKPGVHALYFHAGDEFESVVVSGLSDGVTLCTDDVTVGHPAPAKTPETTP
jgi:hypothetical protein